MKKSKTKIFALAMAAALVMSLTLPASAAQFPDMPTGWSKDAMQAAVDNGLFEGTEDGRINPTGELTRAELAKVIATAFGASVEADLSAYTDVNGSWYTQPMALAVKMGVINGTGATSMSPTRKVTRQEAATILARALKLTDGTAADLAAFSDANEIGSWFVGPMAAMVKAGYLNGSDGKLNPTQVMTRESLAVMMYNIFTTYIQKSGEVTEVPEGNVMISAPDVTLKGVNVTGDLIIGDGVGEGDVVIDNCTIGGGVIVRGGGVNSVRFISTTVTKTVVVTKTTGPVRVYSDSDSTVATSVVSASGAVTLEGTFTTVEIATSEAAVEAKNVTAETVSVTAAEASVTMTDSTVATVAVTAAGTTVAMANTTATTVTVAQAANVEMTGATKVETMAVTSTDVVVSTTGDVVITTVQTDVTVVVTGDGTVENTEGSGEVVDTPPAVDPSPAPSESAEPTEPGDATDVGVSTTPTPAAHVHSAVYKYTSEKHWQVCAADGHVDDDDFTDGTEANGAAHKLDNGRCVCGYSLTTSGTAKPDCEHTNMTEDTDASVAPTCTTAGKLVKVCGDEDCTYTTTETVAALGHAYTVEQAGTAVDPTCTNAGKAADKKCSREGCDAVQTGATVAAVGHTATEGVYSHNGTYHWQVCTRAVGDGTCGAQFNFAAHTLVDGACACGYGASVPDPTPDDGHTHGSWSYTQKDATQHTKTCGAEGCTDTPYSVDEAHNWNASTGKCGDCGQDCPNTSDHGNIEQGKTCTTCGYAGQKTPTVPSTDACCAACTTASCNCDGSCTESSTCGTSGCTTCQGN